MERSMVVFLFLILLVGLSLATNYFIFPSMYKDYIEKQGLPVYPNSKIRVAKLDAIPGHGVFMKESNFLTFFDKNNKDIGFFIASFGPTREINNFYKEKLKNKGKFKGGKLGMKIKVGEKVMIDIRCVSKCDSKSGLNDIQIMIPDPAGNFSNARIHGYNF